MKKPFVSDKIGFALAAGLILFIGYIIGLNLQVCLFVFSLAVYLRLRKKQRAICSFLNLSLLYLIIFVASYYTIKQGAAIFYIPFCVVPMLAAMLFEDLEVSLVLTLAAAFSVASLYGNQLYLGLLFLTSGIFSTLLVYNLRRRMNIIHAGFIVGLIQALSLFFLDRLIFSGPARYLFFVLNGIISSIVVVGILPVFEYLFRTATNITLLELADFNHPLLQKMILEAPGTYHHSLIVGNLSEAACRAVGANALLSRIGAYYHDIGKIEKAGYFSENQQIQESKHDSLSPTISKLIIMNHVKEGVELAKKYKINPRLIDFILQHHGNSLVYYFYRRALEGLEEDQEIKEEGFRYPGPKPNTKETAIVLLADSVEAATRALKEHTPDKVREVVHKIINNKFIDGQLDECDLTLKDLEKISAVFIHILTGIYHNRISYPEKDLSSESSHKKPPKENSHQSGKDKKSGS